MLELLAGTLGTALGSTVGTVIAVAVAVVLALIPLIIAVLLVNELCPVCLEVLQTIAIEPLSIPTVSTVILWSQLGALAVAVVARVALGVKEIVLDPRPGGPSFAGWLAKSLLSIAGVALMPTFCNMVITLGTSMFSSIQGWTSDSLVLQSNVFEWEDLLNVLSYNLDGLLAVAAASGLAIVVGYNCLMTAIDLAKRQFTMLVVSITATWVSVKAALDSADDYLDVLLSLFFLCVTQWVQYLFLAIAVTYLNDFTDGTALWLVDVTTADGMWSMVLVMAVLGCARAVPDIIERYAFSVGRSGMGNVLVGQLVRGGLGAVTGFGRRVGSNALVRRAAAERTAAKRGQG